MKRTLLFVLALAVIPVGVDAQVSDLEQTHALAEQGNALAQYDLGAMYHNGLGGPKDYVEAVLWYRLVAEQGDAYAQTGLGFLYAIGEGVPEDYVFAYMWLNFAVAQVIIRAQGSQSRLAIGLF